MDDFTNLTQASSTPDAFAGNPNAPAFCGKCGSPHAADDAFCPSCGNKINISVERQVAVVSSASTAMIDTSGALNREAVILYTTDIVALEFEAKRIGDTISDRGRVASTLGVAKTFHAPQITSLERPDRDDAEEDLEWVLFHYWEKSLPPNLRWPSEPQIKKIETEALWRFQSAGLDGTAIYRRYVKSAGGLFS